MPTYIYETVEPNPVRFEIKQSMRDEPLTAHPQTGVPVRRVISGGYGLIVKTSVVTGPCGAPCSEPAAQSCCGGGGCCHTH